MILAPLVVPLMALLSLVVLGGCLAVRTPQWSVAEVRVVMPSAIRAVKEPAPKAAVVSASHVLTNTADTTAAFDSLVFSHANKLLHGYTLQLYKGFARSRAEQIQTMAKTLNRSSTLSYEQPYYLVESGFFLNFLQAHAQASQLKKVGKRKLKSILILPTKIPIQTYLLPE